MYLVTIPNRERSLYECTCTCMCFTYLKRAPIVPRLNRTPNAGGLALSMAQPCVCVCVYII